MILKYKSTYLKVVELILELLPRTHDSHHQEEVHSQAEDTIFFFRHLAQEI